MRLTKKDIIYNKLNVAIDAFVNDSETFMTMYFAIKEYEKQYPSYYKTNFLKRKLQYSLDNVERLDV